MIPCVQEADCFDATLASVLQNRPADCEVLVIQPRGYDDPYDLKGEVRFLEAPANSTLVDLINVGVEEAVGEIVHLLLCDVEVTDGWTAPALRHFRDPTVGSVAPRVVRKASSSRVISRGVCYGLGGTRVPHCAALTGRTARRRITAASLCAGLYRRQALREVGGFNPSLGDDFADVDLGLMLQAAGYRCVHEENSTVTTSRTTDRGRFSFASGRAAERLFWRNTEPRDWASILLAHPYAWLTETICNLHRPQVFLQLLGRLQGWFKRGAAQRQQQCHLRTLRQNHAAAQRSSSSVDPASIAAESGSPSPKSRAAA